MLQFLYIENYKHDQISPGDRLLHVRTYFLADKYGINSLMDLAVSKFSKSTKRGFRDNDAFTYTVRWVYKKLPEGHLFRNLALLGILENMPSLLEDNQGPCCTLMVENGEIGKDVARALRCNQDIKWGDYTAADRRPGATLLTTYWCKPGCNRFWRLNEAELYAPDLDCPACPEDEPMKKISDCGITLLYNLSCRNCSNTLMCSEDEDVEEWYCCYCRRVGTIKRKELNV
jgi:hypothetical protein